MALLPDKELSYWATTTVDSPYPKLDADLAVEAVVIGGGISGLNTAYLLKKEGFTVAVLEKNKIGHGVTNKTTGKVTSQHSKIYAELYDRFGNKKARRYGEASEEAIAQTGKIIRDENISCDWRRDDSYVFTTDPRESGELRVEAEIAKKLGLPAEYVSDTPLPFEVKAAVKFNNQAKFNVSKYITGLAKAINGNGGYIFENTRANVTGVKDNKPCKVKTGNGTITCNHVIVCTNVPFTAGARGSYCAKEYPTKSYIVAGKPEKPFKGMYISPDKNHYSILPFTDNLGTLVLVGGENHIPGIRGSTDSRYQKLAEYAKKHFGVNTIDYKWAARDYMSYDSIPLIGKLYPWSDNVYVSTAYMKWGLTNTMVSAMILRDEIAGRKNAWADTFDSSRLQPVKSIPRVFAEYAGLK